MQRTLNDPIDGNELKQIILSRISEQLDKDCTLADDIAYAAFSLNFTINIHYLRLYAGNTSTVIWGDESGDIAKLNASETESATLTDSYETNSPNRAREDHNLDIPVMETLPSGITQRRKVGRPPKPKSEVPA